MTSYYARFLPVVTSSLLLQLTHLDYHQEHFYQTSHSSVIITAPFVPRGNFWSSALMTLENESFSYPYSQAIGCWTEIPFLPFFQTLLNMSHFIPALRAHVIIIFRRRHHIISSDHEFWSKEERIFGMRLVKMDFRQNQKWKLINFQQWITAF